MLRAASVTTACSVMFCAVVLLAGCGSPTAGPAVSSTTTTSSGAPTTSAVLTGGDAPATAVPATAVPATAVPVGWKQFITGDGRMTFVYPENWTVNDVTPAAKGAAVDVLTDYGKAIASLRTGVVMAPQCTAKMPFMQYDSAPVPALMQEVLTPRFVYEARTDRTASDPAKATTFAYGLTSQPEPAGTEACPIAHVFSWPPSGASFGGGYDPFDTTPGGPRLVDSPEAYKDTAEYRAAKQMIMSLRPAGR